MLIVLRLPYIIFLFKFLRSMVFTTASVPLIGDRNLRRKDVTALLSAICSKTYPSFLTVKEGSTFLTKPLFPQEREDVTALQCSEPLRYMVGGPSKVSPDFAGWDRLEIAVYSLLFFVVIC